MRYKICEKSMAYRLKLRNKNRMWVVKFFTVKKISEHSCPVYSMNANGNTFSYSCFKSSNNHNVQNHKSRFIPSWHSESKLIRKPTCIRKT